MSERKPFEILAPTPPGPLADPMTPLRLEAATALERGLGFVENARDEFALTCALATLDAIASEEALASLEARQEVDGSFEPLGSVLSGSRMVELREGGVEEKLIGCLEALSLLADWRQLYAPCSERVVAYLSDAQAEDGAWGPVGTPDAQSTPRLFMTGMLSGFVARTRSARPKLLSASMEYLASQWSVERIRRDGWLLVAAYSHHFAGSVDENRDVALPWCGRELERGFAAGEYGGCETIRVLLYCDAATLPGANFDVANLLGAILSEQAHDGGWAPDEPEPRGRLGPTLDAMAGMIKLCRVAPVD